MASQEDNSYLVVSNTSNQDAGVYTATATNSHGEARSYGRLTVNEQTSEGSVSRSVESSSHFSASSSSTTTTTATANRIGGQPPEFKKLFFDRHVTPGEDVRLDAVITGSPKPKIKWLLPQDNLPQDNCRCIMAGDSYSFIISDFQEKNVGRYSITAENQHGKATCSAKVLFEGTDFSEIPDEPVLDVAASSDEAYVKDLISAAKSNLFSSTTTTTTTSSSASTTSAVAESKTIGVETIPVVTRELSTQSAIPQMRDISAQAASTLDTKETGIQITTDVTDKSSQIESVRAAGTRDEASQSDFERRVSSVVVESAPFAQTTAESHFSSKSSVEQSRSNVTRSFSYTQQQQQQSVGISSSSSIGMMGAQSGSTSRTTSITATAVPRQQQPQPVSADYSTTLIKDINQHYEPVELILNRSDSAQSHHHHQAHSSSTYIKEVDHHHQQQQQQHQRQQINRFEPVNLIFPRPFYGVGRSGSLPPVVSRVNYKSSTRSDFEHTDTEDDASLYYQAEKSVENKENMTTYSAESKLTYYKGIERKARPQFKPVELVLDASSLSDAGNKRYRDTSYPTTAQSKRIRTPVTSSFIYDNSNNENDSSASDFISSEQESKVRQVRTSQVTANLEEKETKGLAVKLPCMEMTIDLKAPPTIEVPLKNVHSAEGQFVKLECVVNGKPAPTVKWYKEGNEIEPNGAEGIEISFEAGVGVATLAIRQVSLRDSGRYTCVARNVIGSCSSSATITIQGKNENSFHHGASSSAQQLRAQRNLMNQSSTEQHVAQQQQQQQHLQQHLYQLQMQQQQYQQQQQVIQQQQFEQQQQYQAQHRQQQQRIEHQQFHQQLDQQHQQRLIQMSKSNKTEEEFAQEQQYQQFQQQQYQEQQFQQQQFQQQQQYQQQTSLAESKHSQSMEMIYNEIDPSRPEPQLLRSLPNYLRFTEGQPARLEIEVSGTPAPIVNWFKNNSLIPRAGDIEITTNENVHTLSIPEIYVEDSGVYKAVIASPLGVLESLCEIKVEGVAKKSSSPRSQSDSPQRRKQRIDQQQEYARYEHASQFQLQQQQQQQHQQVHQQSERKLSYYSQTEVKPYQHTVQMTPTQPRASSVSKSVSITPLQKPQFVKHLQNATFKHGEIALIQCIAKGSPDTVVKWYRNGNPIEANDDYAMAYDINNGLCSLSIAEARSQDSGQYTCVATNAIGSESSTAWIVVKESSQERNQQQQQAQKVAIRPGFQKQTTPLRLGQIESSKVETSETSSFSQQVQRSEMVSVESGAKPRVLEPLRDVEFVEAASALLECRLQGHPLSIQWYKGNSPIVSQYRYKMSHDEVSGMARLFIATVLEDDAGEYTCRATNQFGDVSTTAHLIPTETPSEFGKYVVGKYGAPAPVQPPPQQEEPVKRKPEEAQRPQSKQLRPSSRENYYTPQPMPPMTPQPMPPMTPQPMMDDVFESPNKFAFVDQPPQPMPPKILRGLKSEQVNEDDTIILKALVNGNPFPRCSWYKNNYPLIMSQRHFTYEEESKKLCGLKVKNAKEDDSGVYTLVVDNLYGSDDSTATVVVNVAGDPRRLRPRHGSFSGAPLQPQNERLQPPRVVTHLLPEITITEGEPIVLSCMIEALPLPQIAIFKNEVPLPASARVKTTFDPNSGILTVRIDDTTVNDAGSYRICADNVCGRAETNSAVYVGKSPVIESTSNIDPEAYKSMHRPESVAPAAPTPAPEPVQAEPAQEPSAFDQFLAPNFLIGLPPNYKLHEGESIKLTCQVEGNPRPLVSWLKDGKSLPQSLRFNTSYIVPTGVASLTVTGCLLTDCGNYTCVAENPAGKAYTTSQVFVKESSSADPLRNLRARKYESAEDSQTDDDVPLNRAKPPKVIHGLVNQKTREGETVVMACKIDGFPKPHLIWLKDGFEMPASNRYTSHYDLNTGVARLVIGGAVPNDAGVYSVVAENKAGSDRTDARLDVEKDSGVDTKPIATGSFAIYRPTDLQPTPQPPVQPVEMQQYDPTGYATSEYEEEPATPPRVIVPLKDQTANEGQPITLMAKITGTPAPRILWLHNSRPIQESSRYAYNYEISTGIASFRINGVQVNDAGTYTAVAENRAGSVETTSRLDLAQVSYIDTAPIVNPEAFRFLERPAQLQQQRKLRTPSASDNRYVETPRVPESPRQSRAGFVDKNLQPPRFVIPLQNVRIEEGKSISLACKVEGYPKPRVTWFKDSKPLSASTRYTPDYDLYTGIVKLHISDAQMHDAGHYAAVAENDAGQDQTSCNAAIKQVPSIDRTPMVNPNAFRYLEHLPTERAPRDKVEKLTPPRVVIPLQNVKLEEGQSVVLACKIEGFPKPRLTWYKDSVVLPAATRYTTDYDLSTNVATLKIDNAQLKDLGAYVVLAENEAGSDQTTCTVFIQQVPSIDRTPMVNPDAFRYLENRSAPKSRVFDEENVNLLAPKVVVPLKDMELKEEEPVLLICKIEGKPRPKLTWFKNNEPLMASQRYDIDYNLSTSVASLHIKQTKPLDIGVYRLVAENIMGKADTTCQLFVKASPNIDETAYVDPSSFRSLETPHKQPAASDSDDVGQPQAPIIVKPLQDQECFEGEIATFVCEVKGNPRPTIHWTQDGAPLKAAQRVAANYLINEGKAIIVISNVKQGDLGKYTLTAKNKVGEASTSANLTVKLVPTIDDTSYVNPEAFQQFETPGQQASAGGDEQYKKPYFVKVPKNANVREGAVLRLDCLAFGRPFPVLTWFFNGTELLQDANHKVLINEEGVNSLLIPTARFGDSGIYSCVARNKAGEASFNVEIKVVDKDAMIAPFFIEHLKNSQFIPEGQDAILSCTCSGTPIPTIVWQKDVQELTPDVEYRIDTNGGHSRLFIQCAVKEDDGWYTCTATNAAGTAMTRTKINVLPPGQVNVVTPDLSKLNKTPQDLQQVPGFVSTLQNLKHVVGQQGPVRLPPEIIGQNFGSIWSKDELEDQETMYNKDKPIPPKFKTHFKSQLNLRERQPARFFAKLIPIGDPTMKIQWYRNGEPLRSATRYEIKYDFGLVSLDLLWSYPEDNGVYECVATNECGQDRTRAELKCKANRSIIYDTQLPEGLESHYRLQELEDKLKIQSLIKEEVPEDEQPEPCAPEVVLKLENAVAEEGGLAKFMAKITGYPKPRVHWFVNETHAISGSKFKLYFDGMIHYLDIPKTVKAEHEGTIRCFAKNMMGQCETTCHLRIKPKIDYRSVLRNRSSDMDETFYQPVTKTEDRMTTPERKLMERVSTLSRPKQKHATHADNRVPPKFIRQLEPKNATEGDEILLSVEFTGNPTSEVFWYKDGLQMESSVDFHIESTSTGSVLKIREGYKSDSGIYQVKLFNEVGIAQCKAYLSIVPIHLQDMTPKILLELANLTVNSGDPVKFQTQAKGDPAPILTWFKDDEPLEMSTRVKEFVEENVHTLLIMESLAADSGCYECVAENAHGKTYTRAYLNVIGDKPAEEKQGEQQQQHTGVKSVPLSSRYTQPAIEVPLADQVVKEGASAKFECTIAHSADHAHVHWYKDDKVIKQSKYFNMTSNKTTHCLNILEAFPEDEGVYKCVAKNPAGQVSTTAHLKIEQNLQVPEFVTTINDTEADETAPTKLSAKIKPDPTVQVEWSHDGNVLKDSANYILKSNKNGEITLLINSTKQKDAGTYTLKVFNGAGTINCSANLIVKSMFKQQHQQPHNTDTSPASSSAASQ